MLQMVGQFAAMGMIEARPGIANDPDLPAVMFVESLPPGQALRLADSGRAPQTRLEEAGWDSEEQLESFRKLLRLR